MLHILRRTRPLEDIFEVKLGIQYSTSAACLQETTEDTTDNTVDGSDEEAVSDLLDLGDAGGDLLVDGASDGDGGGGEGEKGLGDGAGGGQNPLELRLDLVEGS